MTSVLNRVRTSVLEIAYEQSGSEDGVPVLLMHGFPYDPRTYDLVVPLLVAAGCRAIVPYLRGYGPTRFLAAETPRSGQQAALGNDLKELIDALGCAAPCWPAMIGAGARPASSPRSGLTRCAAWCQPTATTFRISPDRQNLRRRSWSTGFGINTISTPSAVVPG